MGGIYTNSGSSYAGSLGIYTNSGSTYSDENENVLSEIPYNNGFCFDLSILEVRDVLSQVIEVRDALSQVNIAVNEDPRAMKLLIENYCFIGYDQVLCEYLIAALY